MNEILNSRDRRIFEALNGIDEKYIAEVTERYEVFDPCASYAPTRRAKRRMAIRLTAFAACLVLVALCLPALSRVLQYYGIIGPGTEAPSVTTEPDQTQTPETGDPDVTDIPDTDEDTDLPVPPEEPSCFASYDSILEVLKSISNICATSANIAADRSSYKATLKFASETESEWFERLFESAVSARYEKDLPYGYSIGDVNGDGVNELLYLREDYMLLAVFSNNGSPVLIESFTDRYRGYIDTDGRIFAFDADDGHPDVAIYEISEGRDSLETVSALAMTGSNHTETGAYKLTGDKREEITREEYWEQVKKAPFKDEDDLHTENNAGVEFVEFEKIEQPALSEAELIAIFEEVFAGKRTVSRSGADPKMFGYFYLGESEGEKVYMYMSDDVEMLYLDLDRDGYVEAVVNINDSILYILRYDRESDTVNSYVNSYASLSYADEIFYTNGEFGSSTYRYRIIKFGKNLSNTEIERIEYAELGIEPEGEKVRWTKIEAVIDIDPPTPAGNDKISAEFSDTRPAGMNESNSRIYMAISDNSALMSYIVFTAREKLTNVRPYELDSSLYEYEFGEKIWHTHELNEDMPLLAGVVFYGSMTAYGISFRDEAGEEHHFAVRTRGDGGSLELVEYTPVGDDPYEEWLAAYVDLGFGEVCISDILYDATYDGPITYPATFKIARFDINRDGVEDILVTHGSYSETVVFDGASKGQSYQIFGFRGMYGMQTNGVFFWHERAGTVQIASRFKKGSLQIEEIYRREIGFEEDDEYQYFVGGVEVTKEEYDKCLAENEAPKIELETLDVVWKAVDYLGVG